MLTWFRYAYADPDLKIADGLLAQLELVGGRCGSLPEPKRRPRQVSRAECGVPGPSRAPPLGGNTKNQPSHVVSGDP
ncbi:MAG: hypothetical protein K2Y56_19010 [Methylobacterium sp.]|uniref:hypothetical protein n=1 Tax=Methylobacterium sp. TaxID=409 RepID=UPI0025F7D61F|nr:hypothetical protein [Methylobacterium sp.]MBX9933581.1 hypothetical protein [Methylobacterium sp.]